MKILERIVSIIGKKRNKSSHRRDYIYYKVVDFSEEDHKYQIRCINTKAVVALTLLEVIADVDILFGLHPVQACFFWD